MPFFNRLHLLFSKKAFCLLKTRYLPVVMTLLVSACANISKPEKADEQDQPLADAVLVGDGERINPIPQPQNPNPVDIPSKARSEFSQAKKMMLSEEWKKAKGLLLLMSETYPNLAGVYTNLGIVYQQLEQYDDAEKAYQFAIETNPYNFDAYANLGVLFREQGKFDQAKSTYLSALALWPHHRASVLNLGILYDLYLGNNPQALQQFKLAQQLNSEDDRKLKGWIVDLERRIKRTSKAKPVQDDARGGS